MKRSPINRVEAWLMEGDSSIRWQAMRDLNLASEEEWQAERALIPTSGWGARFLAELREDGTWSEGRWTDTVWTLQTLMDLGFPANHKRVQDAACRFIDHQLTETRALDASWLRTRIDLCHLGFWLRIGSYFLGNEPRFLNLINFIVQLQMSDGGWNCRIRTHPETSHSSFHTTFNILEGLKEAERAGTISSQRLRKTEAKALEFMLQHRMYRSDKTGEIIKEQFTHLTYPSHWHYNIIRGLDYMRNCPEIGDDRLEDSIKLLESRRLPTGEWPLEKRIPGSTLFDMEKPGSISRWNTLRMLRILKRRNGQHE